MGIAVLGPVAVDGSTDRLGRRDRVVLTALAVRAGDPVSADELADAIWNDGPPSSAAKVVQGCVVRLRKLLGRDSIETVPGGYRLALPGDEVDAHRFEQGVARARELLALGDPERASYLLTEMCDLWRGRALPDLEDWESGRIEASRLDEVRRDAQELRVEALLRAGHHGEVLGEAHALVRSAPLRERRWMLLALAQYQSGRQAESLRTLRELGAMLDRELGLEPGPDVAALEQAILKQDPSLTVDAALPAAATACPYQGLVPFDVDDAENYFGREHQVEECLDRLRRDGVLVVAGPSGCGKSSLVRAGIAARLRRTGSRVTVLTPGRDPLDSLLGVPTSSRRAYVVVDQFEELFTVTRDAEERRRFLDALVDLAGTTPLVIALRADRLGDVSAHPAFAALVERGLFVLVGMDAVGLREAIEAPSRQAGLMIEPGLVDLLVNEVEREPGALPLLSHALRETWLHREGRTLTVQAYRESGGIRGSIAQSAEAVYQQVGTERQPHLHALMLRLVAPGIEGEPVRARVLRRQVVTDGHAELVDRLVASRLVTSDAHVVEVAHEALVRSWPRLRQWLQEDVEGQRTLHHLSDAADAWHSLGRPDSELYRGVRLARAAEWRDRTSPSLTGVERAFLDAAKSVSERELRQAEDRARTTTRTNRRLRALLAVVLTLLVAAGAAGLYAERQRAGASASAAEAELSARAAEARRLGAGALSVEDMSLSLLLAVQAYRLDPSPQTRTSLHNALARHAALSRSFSVGTAALTRLSLAPDGRSVAIADIDNKVWQLDLRSGEIGGVYDSDDDRQALHPTGAPVEYSPDGTFLAVGMQTFDPLPVRLLDPVDTASLTGQLGGFPSTPTRAVDIAFSADGRFLAASLHLFRPSQVSPDPYRSTVYVWDLTRPDRPVARLPQKDAFVTQHIALDSDGSTVFVSYPLHAIDVLTGRTTMEADTGYWQSLALSPDDSLVAITDAFARSDRLQVVLVDASTGKVVRRLPGSGAEPVQVAFSHDGSMVAATSTDRSARVWRVDTGERIHEIEVFEELVTGLAFGPDDATLYTSEDGMLRVWDLAGSRRYLRALPADVPPQPNVVTSVGRPAPGGLRVAYFGELGRNRARDIAFLDVGTGTLAGPFATGLRGIADSGLFVNGAGDWHPDRRHYAIGDAEGRVQVWDAQTGHMSVERLIPGGRITAVDHTPDGDRLVVTRQAGTVSWLDSETLQPVGGTVDVDAPVCCAAVGPDGRRVFVATGAPLRRGTFNGQSSGWALVDLSAGEVVSRGTSGVQDILAVAYSPRGDTAMVAGRPGVTQLIDLAEARPARPPVDGHDGSALTIAYDSTGRRAVTAGFDGSAALWDGVTGELLGSVVSPDRQPSAAAFRDDGDVLVATHDVGVFEWDTRVAHALSFACRAAGRDLTRAEWRQYVPGRPYQPTCPGQSDGGT